MRSAKATAARTDTATPAPSTKVSRTVKRDGSAGGRKKPDKSPRPREGLSQPPRIAPQELGALGPAGRGHKQRSGRSSGLSSDEVCLRTGAPDDSVAEGSIEEARHRACLLLQLRGAMDEITGLRRDVAAAVQERQLWQRRDEELSRSVSCLENRCGVLEDTLKIEQEAVLRENSKATAAESNFETLLAWARQEERRRCEAQEDQLRASEKATVLEARATVAEQEARESGQQLDDRRVRLESALEDLRRRTSDNERLEDRTKGMAGEILALRQLADARSLEVKELREKLSRVVKEAKDMASENVEARKHLSVEQERRRSDDRSRAKHDERRRMELERKADDIHALRYRVQELEARLTAETVRRQGAEEDARRSQQMEQRTLEELLQTRKRTSLCTGPFQSQHNADSEDIARFRTASGHHGPSDDSSATFIQQPASGGRLWPSQDSSSMKPSSGQANLLDPMKVRFWTQDVHGSMPQSSLAKNEAPKPCIPPQFSSSPPLRAGRLGHVEPVGLSTVDGASSSAARYWSSAAHTDVSCTGLASPGSGPGAFEATLQDSARQSGDGSGAGSRTRPRPRQVPRDDSFENDDHNDHADDNQGDIPNGRSDKNGKTRLDGASSTSTASSDDGLRTVGLENNPRWRDAAEAREQVDQWWRGDDDFSDSEREL